MGKTQCRYTSRNQAIEEELKPPDRREASNPKPIPPHYGLNKNALKATKEVNRSVTAALINSSEFLNIADTFSDDDSSSDDDDTRMIAMLISCDDKIKVQASLDYEKRFIKLVHSPRMCYAK